MAMAILRSHRSLVQISFLWRLSARSIIFWRQSGWLTEGGWTNAATQS